MKAKSHQSLKYITCSDSVAASWCSLWDHALDYGTKGTKLLQILFSSLCQPLFSDRHCHLCENSILPANECFFSHFTLQGEHYFNIRRGRGKGPGTGRGRGYLLPYHSQTLEGRGLGTFRGCDNHHVRAIFADSARRNVCESPIIKDRGISADLY